MVSNLLKDDLYQNSNTRKVFSSKRLLRDSPAVPCVGQYDMKSGNSCRCCLGKVKCMIRIYKCSPFPSFPQTCSEIPHTISTAWQLLLLFFGVLLLSTFLWHHIQLAFLYRLVGTAWKKGRSVLGGVELKWNQPTVKTGLKSGLLHKYVIFKDCKSSLFFSFFHSPDSSYETMTSKWPSVWVKISSSWIGIMLYVWTLVAPLVLTNRDFD